ncbi:MAG: YihY/virulence factor BrkB family protein [Anaerolineae bacterium]
MKAKDTVTLAKDSFKEWSEDKASRLAAALAYYTVFSLAPLLVIAIAVAGFVFGEEAARGEIVAQISGLVGPDAAELIEGMVQRAAEPSSGILATIIGVATLLLGASGVFGQLHDSLNTIWDVEPKPGRGIWGTIKDRFLSFTMVLGVGFLLLVGLVISAGLAALGTFLTGLAPGAETLMQVVNLVISLGLVTLLFALIYKVVPDVEVAWRDVWIGALVTAVLFAIGRFAIGLYLGTATVGTTFGAAGSLVVLLIWIYYSSQILFLGAEFTQVYANSYGSRIVADEDAVPLSDDVRAKQGMPRRETVEQRVAESKGERTRERGAVGTADDRRRQGVAVGEVEGTREPADDRRPAGGRTYSRASFGSLLAGLGLYAVLRRFRKGNGNDG